MLRAPGHGNVESKLTARPDEAYSVLLRVSDTQAQKLFHVLTHGDWSLQLRPVTDAGDSRETLDTAATVMRGGLGRRNR